MDKPDHHITDAELELMKVLWARQPLAASELGEALAHKHWSAATVKTLLARLVRKGILATRQDGKRFLYEPLVDQESFAREASSSFAQKVLGGLSVPLFARFLADARLSKDEIQELKDLLEKKEHE